MHVRKIGHTRMYKYNQKISFSARELKDLLRSLLVIGLAFTIVDYGFSFSTVFLLTLAISILTAGLGFLLHELAHKIVAQRFGCWSEYRADSLMLVITLALSFLGVVFAAPGAVFISGPMTKKDYGKISAAGPFTNILLSAVFLVVYLLSPESIIGTIAMIGASLNSWIALFNMIPFGNFDGLKIWRWSRAVYFSMVIVSFGLMIATMGI